VFDFWSLNLFCQYAVTLDSLSYSLIFYIIRNQGHWFSHQLSQTPSAFPDVFDMVSEAVWPALVTEDNNARVFKEKDMCICSLPSFLFPFSDFVKEKKMTFLFVSDSYTRRFIVTFPCIYIYIFHIYVL
jgi:hypothetical protein